MIDSSQDLLPTAPPMQGHRRRRGRIALAASVAALAIGATGFLATSASFVDQASVDGNTAQTASLTLEKGVTVQASVALIPGQTIRYDDPSVDLPKIEFFNDGTVPLDYVADITNIRIAGPDGSSLPVEDEEWLRSNLGYTLFGETVGSEIPDDTAIRGSVSGNLLNPVSLSSTTDYNEIWHLGVLKPEQSPFVDPFARVRIQSLTLSNGAPDSVAGATIGFDLTITAEQVED